METGWPDSKFLRRSRWPRKTDDLSDFRIAVKKFVLPGYVPTSPPFHKGQRFFTQGSCFAAEIQASLTSLGITCDHLGVGEEINSALANRVMFEYALTDAPYRCEHHARDMTKEVRDGLRKLVESADAVILTLGLGLEPLQSGEIALSVDFHHLSGIEWRLSTPDENVAHVEAIMQMILGVNPKVGFVLTVSPIPLKNSFLHWSPFAADCASKSVLRSAVEMIMQKQYEGVYYWPAFEAFRWLPAHHGQVFGLGGADQRHIEQSKIDMMTNLFLRYFVATA